MQLLEFAVKGMGTSVGCIRDEEMGGGERQKFGMGQREHRNKWKFESFVVLHFPTYLRRRFFSI